MPANMDWDAIGRDAVATLSRYIQFDTTNPPGDELAAAGWLAGQLRVRGVTEDVVMHEPLEGPFVDAITAGVRKHMPGAGVFSMLVPGATDGRYWRQRGFAAYGFAPVVMERSDLARVHGIDERISAENLLTGIKIARDIIERLCVS